LFSSSMPLPPLSFLAPFSGPAAAAARIQHENTVVERAPPTPNSPNIVNVQQQQQQQNKAGQPQQLQQPLAPVSSSPAAAVGFYPATASAASSPAPPLGARASPILSGGSALLHFLSSLPFACCPPGLPHSQAGWLAYWLAIDSLESHFLANI
jgi:hypothetical protein